MTRRSLLAQAAGVAAAFAQQDGARPDSDPLRQLRPAHPRLIVLDSDIEKIRAAIRENAAAKRIYADLERECDRLLSVPPVEYKLTLNRLQVQTRRAIDRISTLALMYRIGGRDAWLRRAVMELNAGANFRDWNPGRFVDTAEMAHAFAIGYDWLYNSLSPEERAWIRDAMVTKAIDLALPTYQSRNWWTRDRLNWNIVCNSGMTMAALAVADEAPAKASEIVKGALESMPHGLSSWGSDGGWPEGPFFGEYAMRYASLFFASLDSALGSDFGLSAFHGLDRAGRFRAYTTSPSNRVFNFADAPEDPGSAPEMFWMARRFNTPQYSWAEQKQLEKNGRPDSLHLAWFNRDARPPQPPSWPLDAVFRGTNVATFRSSWDDPNALFIACKGGDNKAVHANYDLGTFVFDAGGVRWAADLGSDEPIPAAVQRGTVYRVRTEAHNTLLIDGENQDPKAEAHIVRQEFSPDLSWVQIDLAKSGPKVKQWTRRIGMAQRQAVLMEDSLRSDMPVEVIWGMMTDATDISINGPVATLHKNGWTLSAEIRTPRHAVFDRQAASPKYQKLIVRLADKVTELDLSILLTPYKDGQPKPKITAQFPL